MTSDPWPTPLAEALAGAGPMPFRDYMAEALYADEHGFYTQRDHPGSQRPTGQPGFVRDVARDLAEAFAWFAQAHEPHLVDQGPGRGRLVRYLLATLPDAMRDATEVTFVEPNLARRTRLLVLLQELGVDGRVVSSPRDLDPGPTFVLAKELVGSFPVHWLERARDGWREVHVSFGDQPRTFEESLEAMPPGLARFADEHAAHVPEGARYEGNRRVGRWLAVLAQRLEPGVLAVLDRPVDAEPGPAGSIRATRAGEDVSPYAAPGEVEISAGVDGDLLEAQAGEAGLERSTKALGLSSTGRPHLDSWGFATPELV